VAARFRFKRAKALNVQKEISMFMTLFVILLVMWLLGFFAFHVAGGLIHILLIIAVISLLLHFFRGSRTA
jgi:bacteriorhodopsin